jgi:hypothetical protein
MRTHGRSPGKRPSDVRSSPGSRGPLLLAAATIHATFCSRDVFRRPVVSINLQARIDSPLDPDGARASTCARCAQDAHPEPEERSPPACGAKWATSRFVCVLGKRHSGLALRFAFVDPEVANTQVSTQLTVQPVEQGQEVKVQAEIQLDPEYGLGSYDRVSSTMHVPRKSPSGYASRSRPRMCSYCLEQYGALPPELRRR